MASLALTSSWSQGWHLPKMTLQQFKTHMILSRGALYDLIFNNSVACQPKVEETGWKNTPDRPCCASLRNRFPLSLTGGISKCASWTQP